MGHVEHGADVRKQRPYSLEPKFPIRHHDLEDPISPAQFRHHRFIGMTGCSAFSESDFLIVLAGKPPLRSSAANIEDHCVKGMSGGPKVLFFGRRERASSSLSVFF